jgi:DNA-directed RNA polymerase subunit RPC12/RpoP
MTDSSDKIIVFDAYDTVMAANLVKTKLDAYGIPCFLSDENFGGLYPFRNELFTGVRLHIFEKDRDRVKEILVEEHRTESEVLQCPSCQSDRVVLAKSQSGTIGQIFSTLFVSPFMEEKIIYHCQTCGKEFDVTERS